MYITKKWLDPSNQRRVTNNFKSKFCIESVQTLVPKKKRQQQTNENKKGNKISFGNIHFTDINVVNISHYFLLEDWK